VFVDDSQLQLVNSSFNGNWASAAGGAVLLGPTGARQFVEAVGGSFVGNAAGHFGGAAAGGLLLPGDAAAATARARANGAAGGGSGAQTKWALLFKQTVFANNTAGRQGGALACSLCDSLQLRGSKFSRNFAAQTGGGVSCVGCARFSTERCAFDRNAAASGGGACILAAGEGSQCSGSEFFGNAAGAEAATAARSRLQRQASAAAAIAGASSGGSIPGLPNAADTGLPSAQQALPACGVVGSGGGLCLGLWRTGFGLVGPSNFLNNSALFGAGLFIEACAEGPDVCPMALNPTDTQFKNNVLSQDASGWAQAYAPGVLARRHLLQGSGPVAADMATLQQQQQGRGAGSAAAAAATAGDGLGSGADLYVTNATVLVSLRQPNKAAAAVEGKQGVKAAAAAAAAKPAAAGAAGVPKTPAAAAAKVPAATASAQPAATGAGGRHLLAPEQQQQQQKPAGSSSSSKALDLAVAEQLAAETQPTQKGVSAATAAAAASKPAATTQAKAAAAAGAGLGVADAIAARVATGPAKLGQIVVTGTPFASSFGSKKAAGASAAAAAAASKQKKAGTAGNAAAKGTSAAANAAAETEAENAVEGSVSDTGQIQGVQLPVLDQLGGQVANDVAEQLSVQAVADFGNCTACQLGGISKVLPVNGTARFDQLQLLVRPGSNQSITFKLLSATEGVELPGGRQVVRVQLPSCHWGQATTAVGCYNCTSPLFSFSYSSNKCSICPENAAYCSGTSLLPDSGYWNSGPLSTRMHKCPRRNACLR
jgi:predicted outer membrane repeat protein